MDRSEPLSKCRMPDQSRIIGSIFTFARIGLAENFPSRRGYGASITLPLSVRLFSNIAQVTSQPRTAQLRTRWNLPRPSARAQCGRSAIRLCNARAKRHGRRVLARMATGTRRKTVVGKQPAQRTQRENPLPRARAIMLARSSNSIGHQPPALVSMRTRANARRISSR